MAMPSGESDAAPEAALLYPPVRIAAATGRAGGGLLAIGMPDGKHLCNMSGNGANHPCEFLARVYAQVLLKLLVE